MIVTDVEYPEEGDIDYDRWWANMLKVTRAPYGFEVWYKVKLDVRHIKEDLLQRFSSVEDAHLGLILCEQPNSEIENQVVLQTQIIKTLEKDWYRTGVLSICIVRAEFAACVMARLTPLQQSLPKRMLIVDVNMHYEPLRNTRRFVNDVGVTVGKDSTVWKAFVIKPDKNFPFDDTPLHVPRLILELANRRLRTLQTAAYTLESTVAIKDFYDSVLM